MCVHLCVAVRASACVDETIFVCFDAYFGHDHGDVFLLSARVQVQGIVAMHQVQGDGSAESVSHTLHVCMYSTCSIRIYLHILYVLAYMYST